MNPIWVGSGLSIATTVISVAALWVNVAQGRRQQRQYIEAKLDTMQSQINAVATDVAKIFGWLEGQRDNRISSRAAPDILP